MAASSPIRHHRFALAMHETDADIVALQALLDRSYDAAGPHLRDITTPERRVSAQQLCEQLTGMVLLVLATVTSDGRPIAGPVDGIFYRGAFHFGTSPHAVRARHIRARPQVSATHLPREEFAVTVHGRAVAIDVRAAEGAGLRETLMEIYAPRYGEEWEQFMDPPEDEERPVYFRIEADKLFSFQMVSGGA
jgi:nitroimidazol reductase NimA-like FMN-containing flavoprotein (pyridoxamine 5'-phosphate oxidase superfamily)